MGGRFKFKSNKEKNRLCFFDYTTPSQASGAHIEMFSNKEMVIEGCRGVCEYDSEYLKLRLIKGFIELCGSNFDIQIFEGDVITVRGEISRIEFCI